VLVWSYPLDLLKLVAVMVLISLIKHSWWLVGLLALSLGIFNVYILGQGPAILSKLSMADAKNEVTSRFMAEDSLRIKMELPLLWRRIGYNKLFVTYKQVVGEVLPFFDLETLFFQEVHPMEQKSVVMFYWPEVFLLILGLYVLTTSKIKKETNGLLLALLILGFVNYMLSNTVVYQRLELLLLPLGIVVALGLSQILRHVRPLGVAYAVLVIYAGYTNWYDITHRADYWLDNRPLVYKYWYEGIKTANVDNFPKITVSTLIGTSQNYCWFYLGDVCKDGKFVFNSFDLTKGNIDNGLYAGFTGEFVGSRFKNDFSADWDNELSSKGLELISKENIRDTVAYKYGNDIGLVVKK